MQIWMLIWSYWPAAQGGAERQCRLISPYIVRKGITVTVLTARLSFFTPSEEQDDVVAIRRIGILLPLLLAPLRVAEWIIRFFLRNSSRKYSDAFRFWSTLPFVWLARLFFLSALLFRMLRHRKTLDLIHAHETGWLGAFAVQTGAWLRIPVLCKEATYPPFPIIGWDVPLRRQLRKTQKKGYLIALNEQVKQEMRDNGCQREQITVIPNAVILSTEKAIPEKSNLVLYVGNFSQGASLKGFDILFAAWAKAAPILPECRLVLAGGGERIAWENEVQRLRCSDSVEFKGFIGNLEPLYRTAALLVLPSRIEGMSNALLEAMSWGLPVIASDIPGNRAVVRAEENGMLVPAGDAAALAAAIIRLMSAPDLRSRMGAAGRERAKQEFHPDVVSASLAELYARLTKKEE